MKPLSIFTSVLLLMFTALITMMLAWKHGDVLSFSSNRDGCCETLASIRQSIPNRRGAWMDD